MIISRTPLRISFVGGGSDLPAYYEKYGGAVLSTTINKYIYITVNKKFDNQFRISYSITEIVDSIGQIKHELVRHSLIETNINGGIEITSVSDIPSSGTGLGSSSAYTVGLLHALNAYNNQYVSAEYLASKSCEIEIVKCGKPIGKQDQYASAYGGLNIIEFHPNGQVSVNPIICSPSTKTNLESNLLMLYTGITRSADNILEKQSESSSSSPKTQDSLHKMVSLVYEMKKSLEQNKLDSFGDLLNENWILKRGLINGISNPDIDEWYEIARKAGALGGKLLGAGGGGFLLIYAPINKHAKIIKALSMLKPTKFNFDSQGSKIIYYE